MTTDRPSHKVNHLASGFINAVETAEPGSPITIDYLVKDGTYADLLREELTAFDGFYERHEQLFTPNDDELDYAAICTLTGDMLSAYGKTTRPASAMTLGVATLQLAAAGAEVVQRPELLRTDEAPAIDVLAKAMGRITAEKIDGYRGRWQGSVNGTFVSRMAYPGYLLNNHLAFWREALCIELFSSSLGEQVLEDVARLWPKFPGKIMAYDAHSAAGRPSREVARDEFLKKVAKFEDVLASRQTEGYDMTGNLEPAFTITDKTVEVAKIHAYTPEAAVQLAAQQCVVLGRLTERVLVRFGPWEDLTDIKIENSVDGPKVCLESKPLRYDAITEKFTPKAIRNNLRGGVCPARDVVQLNRDTQVYKNAKLAHDGITEALDTAVPFFHETEDGAYLDLAAMSTAIGAYAIAQNVRD